VSLELTHLIKTRSAWWKGPVLRRTWHLVLMLSLAWGTIQISIIRAQTERLTGQVVPKSTADLITPILDLRYESILKCGTGKDSRCAKGPAADLDLARWNKIEMLVAQLMKNNTPSADRAVVLLLQYYVGESESTDLITSVTTRGKRVLPYLVKYRDLVPRIAGKIYPDSMLTDRELRLTEFDEAIREVKSGKILRVD